MPVIFEMNHEDATSGTPLDPEALIRSISGKSITGGEYNNERGNVNWFKINLADGTSLTIHHFHEGAACIYNDAVKALTP
jgi:hypothetical protein